MESRQDLSAIGLKQRPDRASTLPLPANKANESADARSGFRIHGVALEGLFGAQSRSVLFRTGLIFSERYRRALIAALSLRTMRGDFRESQSNKFRRERTTCGNRAGNGRNAIARANSRAAMQSS